MWTPEKLAAWKEASGKTWTKLAQDLGVGERHLRKIRSGKRIGKPVLAAAERIERRITLREAVDVLKEKKGITQRELAKELGVGERHLRKMLSDKEKEPKEGLPTAYKIFNETKKEGLEKKIPGLEFFLEEFAIDRIGKILGEMFDIQFRGRKRKENIALAKELFARESFDERLEYEAWRVARDVYDEIMGVPVR